METVRPSRPGRSFLSRKEILCSPKMMLGKNGPGARCKGLDLQICLHKSILQDIPRMNVLLMSPPDSKTRERKYSLTLWLRLPHNSFLQRSASPCSSMSPQHRQSQG